ncbi:sodium/pantothenate symporter [Halomonas borealis]|uniref:sodium/pantothenate symporter n=1 Tax=Halomonas borealis TaxID=2508710 RepID=UPI0010A07CCB|nr:sodium/solute symporter [Halomonas borealis]
MYSENSTQVALIIGLYLAITFLFAFISGRRNKQGDFMEEYFVGGRQIGPWVLGLTWIATMASGGTFIGVPGLLYSYGWSVFLWIAGFMVVITTGFGILGKRIGQIGRKTGALTFPDLLRDRFESPAIGILSALMIVVLYLAFMVAQYTAGARVLEAVVGLPYHWGVIGFAVSVALYTAYGGFRAVAWTDSFQAVVMLLGVILTAWFAVDLAGGLEKINTALINESKELVSGPGPDNFLPLVTALSFFILMPLSQLGQPALVSRFLTFTDTRALKRAALLTGLYVCLMYPLIMLVGVTSRVLLPEIESPDHALTATVMMALPAALAGFIIAAPVSAIMSSLSSFLLVTAGAVVRDIYQHNVNPDLSGDKAKTLTHVMTFVITLIGVALALNPPEYLQLIVVFAGAGLGATFAWPTILAIFWPRMNRVGCLAGIIGGFGSFVIQYTTMGSSSLLGVHPFVWSFLLSLAFCVAGSWLAPRQSNEVLEIYFGERSRHGGKLRHATYDAVQ